MYLRISLSIFIHVASLGICPDWTLALAHVCVCDFWCLGCSYALRSRWISLLLKLQSSLASSGDKASMDGWSMDDLWIWWPRNKGWNVVSSSGVHHFCYPWPSLVFVHFVRLILLSCWGFGWVFACGLSRPLLMKRWWSRSSHVWISGKANMMHLCIAVKQEPQFRKELNSG